jgi:hypothetical protein
VLHDPANSVAGQRVKEFDVAGDGEVRQIVLEEVEKLRRIYVGIRDNASDR